LEDVVERVAALARGDRPKLVVPEYLVVALVQAGAGAAEAAPAAGLLGLHLVEIVDREEVRLADLDHRGEAVRLQIPVRVLVPGHQAQRQAPVAEARARIAASLTPVGDRVAHPL